MTIPTPIPSPRRSQLPGLNILLCGPPGTGKTTSLKTLEKVAGLEIFAIFTEPRFDVLGQAFLDKIHWKYISPVALGWQTLIDTGRKVNVMTNDALQKMTNTSNQEYTQFLQILMQCNDFVDQRGEHFGCIDNWSSDRVLILDGLTGMNKMARQLSVGAKPIMSQPDWGVAMQTIATFIDKLTTGRNGGSHFILISHIEREMDEITGGTKKMVSTLGRKLAPTIPINFGDVILATREGASFYWDTADAQADLKPGNLPIAAKIVPDFSTIFASWQNRGGLITSLVP